LFGEMFQGLGDVGEADPPRQRQRRVAHGRQCLRRVGRTHAAAILLQAHVAHAVQPVLYRPVGTVQTQQRSRICSCPRKAGNSVERRYALPTTLDATAPDAADLLQTRPVRVSSEPFSALQRTFLQPPVPLVEAVGAVDFALPHILLPGGKRDRRRPSQSAP